MTNASANAALKAELEHLGRCEDGAVDVAEAALVLAALDCPGVDLEPYRTHLVGLTASLAEHAHARADGAGEAEQRVEALAATMTGEWGYRGDAETYEDPQNANLIKVIDRRRGLPVTLGILYLHAARAQGWAADALAFPGHFLLRVEGEAGDRVIIDPFHEGRLVTTADLRGLLKAISGTSAELTPDIYAAVSNREVLMRLQNNVKIRQMEAGNVEGALRALERMLLISPREHRLWREAGLLHMRLGDLEGAVAALDSFLDLAPPGADRARIEQVMNELRQRLR
jgi:regulator of sirC expression with transglutaminase-like and TPR domain